MQYKFQGTFIGTEHITYKEHNNEYTIKNKIKLCIEKVKNNNFSTKLYKVSKINLENNNETKILYFESGRRLIGTTTISTNYIFFDLEYDPDTIYYQYKNILKNKYIFSYSSFQRIK